MRIRLIKRLLVCCALALPVCAYAQADMRFSQFYETSMLRNPALTGVFEGNYKIAAYYRNQWNSIANPYETILLNLEYHIPVGKTNDFFSFGLLGYNDRAGDLNQKISAVYPALNYNKCLSKYNNSFLSFGFIGGYLQYGFDPSKATFDNQFVGGVYNPANPTFETINVSGMTVYDLGAGVNFNMSPGDESKATYMIGASGYHLTQPSFSYYSGPRYREQMRWNINAGMVHDLGRSTMIQLHANYSQQGTYQEIIAGALLGWRQFQAFSKPSVFEIYAGMLYRYQDAIIPVIKLKYKDFAIGLSYDVNVSTLKTGSKMQGGPEITLNLTGQFPKNRVYPNTVCPRFN